MLQPFLKISFDKWINQTPRYNENTNNTICNDLFYTLLNYIDNSKDLDRFVDDETAYHQFIDFVYRKYLTPKQTYNFGFQRDDLYIHYDFHHNRSIQELFDEMKNYTRSQNSDLFQDKVHNDLVYFIYSICDYDDKMIDDNVVDDLHEDERFEYEMYTDDKQ